MSGNLYFKRRRNGLERLIERKKVSAKFQLNKDHQEVIQLGMAIRIPTRYKILLVLHKSPKSVGQISNLIGVNQPAVSNQLKFLKSLGLVDGFKDGKQVTYKISKGYIRALIQVLNSQLG